MRGTVVTSRAVSIDMTICWCACGGGEDVGVWVWVWVCALPAPQIPHSLKQDTAHSSDASNAISGWRKVAWRIDSNNVQGHGGLQKQRKMHLIGRVRHGLFQNHSPPHAFHACYSSIASFISIHCIHLLLELSRL